MKRVKLYLAAIFFIALYLSPLSVEAQDGMITYTDATELTMIGKIAPTANPYHRVDLESYPDLTSTERNLLKFPAGVAVVFKTNSNIIGVKASYAHRNVRPNAPEMTTAGFDLYIKRDGEWVFAGCGVPSGDKPLTLVKNMDKSEKECLLYLPMYSELSALEVGVSEVARISPMPDPFRHRIVIFGSSFTHGVSTSRAGMSYPLQIARKTGLGIINLGVSGNSKLQPAFAEILAEAEADAFIFDAFSNPTPEQVEQRIAPFVERLRRAHPGKPLIFLQTIHRENCNFDSVLRSREELKRDMARRMVKQIMESDRDVYFIEVENLTGTDHLTSADGVHPSDLGYYRWAEGIQPFVTEILARYDIE